jgi:hypothetical protein
MYGWALTVRVKVSKIKKNNARAVKSTETWNSILFACSSLLSFALIR